MNVKRYAIFVVMLLLGGLLLNVPKPWTTVDSSATYTVCLGLNGWRSRCYFSNLGDDAHSDTVKSFLHLDWEPINRRLEDALVWTVNYSILPSALNRADLHLDHRLEVNLALYRAYGILILYGPPYSRRDQTGAIVVNAYQLSRPVGIATLVLGATGLFATKLLPRLRARYRIRRGRCGVCGYPRDIANRTAVTCPECGNPGPGSMGRVATTTAS